MFKPELLRKMPLNIHCVEADCVVPPLMDGPPRAGERVRQTEPEYEGTAVYHALYLPTDWQEGRKYPVIVEYAGNGGFHNELGDVSRGRVEAAIWDSAFRGDEASSGCACRSSTPRP